MTFYKGVFADETSNTGIPKAHLSIFCSFIQISPLTWMLGKWTLVSLVTSLGFQSVPEGRTLPPALISVSQLWEVCFRYFGHNFHASHLLFREACISGYMNVAPIITALSLGEPNSLWQPPTDCLQLPFYNLNHSQHSGVHRAFVHPNGVNIFLVHSIPKKEASNHTA